MEQPIQPTIPSATTSEAPNINMFGAAAVSGFSNATTSENTGGLILPVQALTAEFVLSQQGDPIAAAGAVALGSANMLQEASAAATPAESSAAIAQMLAESLPQTPAELQALGAGQALDAEFIVGAAQRQGFLLGDVGVMVAYEDGSELTDVPHLYYLPNAPTWFLGMANLHGNMIPVFDLAAYLGVSQGNEAAELGEKENIDSKRMLLVLAHGADAAGVVVHGIPQRLYVMQEQGMTPDVAPNLLLPHVSNAYLIDDKVWFDLEVDSLLATLEGAIQTM